MSRNTDTGANVASQQILEQNINENVRMDETGSFFIDPLANGGEFGLSMEDLSYMVYKHGELARRYDDLMKYYRGNHKAIINKAGKGIGKPDNRIILNYPKQLVNAYVGYFAGVNPAFSVGEDDDKTDESLERANEDMKQFNDKNNINHFYVQQSKLVDIFGRSLALVYQDETGQTKVTTVDPRNGFIVYSNDVSATPVFAVRYRKVNAITSETTVDVYAFCKYHASENGSVSTKTLNYHAENIKVEPGVDDFVDFEVDSIEYGQLPMIEFASNDERLGLYQDLITVFDAIDSAISEKKNDVDYFGDAILALNNLLIDKKGLATLRDDRILVTQAVGDGQATQNAEFLDKPTADGTQENLINRLVSSIYQISGVVDLNDKDFTNAASGQALKQRLQGMRQNADTKASFFDRAFKNIYSCLFTGLRTPEMAANVKIRFKKNEPLDILDESQALVNLTKAKNSGIISQQTVLENMSYIDNAKEEINRINSEREVDKQNMEDVQVND